MNFHPFLNVHYVITHHSTFFHSVLPSEEARSRPGAAAVSVRRASEDADGNSRRPGGPEGGAGEGRLEPEER